MEKKMETEMETRGIQKFKVVGIVFRVQGLEFRGLEL